MAELAVEIDEVRENQRAVLSRLRGLQRAIPQRRQPIAFAAVADRAVAEDVIDLANGPDRTPGFHDSVEQVTRRGRDRKIPPIARAPVAGTIICAAPAPGKGPGDDAADVERVTNTARHLADGVQPVESEGLLMGCDLEHGIGAGVDDRLAAETVLVAQFSDDGGAAGVLVAQHAGQVAGLDQRFDQRIGKARPGPGKVAPVKVHRRAANLIVTAGRILAARCLDG